MFVSQAAGQNSPPQQEDVPFCESSMPVSDVPVRVSASSSDAFLYLQEDSRVGRNSLKIEPAAVENFPEDPERQVFRLVHQESLQTDILFALLKSRPDIAVKIDFRGKNILHYLFERKSSPNIGAIVLFTLGKMSPEEISACDFFRSIVRRKKISNTALKLLLLKGVKPTGLQQMSPAFRQQIVKNIVQWACENPGNPRFSEAIRASIRDFPDLLEETDSDGNTLLHLILGYYAGNSEEITNLIKVIIASMKPETINSYNRVAPGFDIGYETPLHRYCKNIHASPEIVKCLLDAGANPILLSKWNRPIEYVEALLNCFDARKELQPDLENIWRLLAEAANSRDYERKTMLPHLLPGPEGISSLTERDRLSYWSDQAIRYVRFTGVIGAPNNTDVRKTGGWSVKVADEWLGPRLKPYHDKVVEWSKTVPSPYDLKELLAANALKRAAMLCLARGGGDCFKQASLGFFYLYNKGIPVEYLTMYKGSHHFLVLGRDRNSNMNDPLTWGPSAIICDPWTGFSLPACKWKVRSQFDDIKEGIPSMAFDHEVVNRMSQEVRAILLDWDIELIPVEDPLSERKYTIRFKTPMLSPEEQAVRREYYAPVHAQIVGK